jgi:hypothetical protein
MVFSCHVQRRRRPFRVTTGDLDCRWSERLPNGLFFVSDTDDSIAASLAPGEPFQAVVLDPQVKIDVWVFGEIFELFGGVLFEVLVHGGSSLVTGLIIQGRCPMSSVPPPRARHRSWRFS